MIIGKAKYLVEPYKIVKKGNIMKGVQISSASETPSFPEVPPPPPPPPPPTKMPRKSLYIVIGLIAIVAVASVFAFIYLTSSGGSSGEGTTIPLSMNYEEGESMTYSITMTISGMGQQITQTATINMEILDFDGEIYTIHYQMNMQGYSSSSLDFTVRMNKTGYVIEGLPPELQQYYNAFTCIPGYGSYFPKTEMKLGENIQIPLNLEIAGVYMTGNMNFKISELTTKTFPNIGALKVFKLEVSAPNIQATYQGISMTATINGYGYYEYGTCLLVECAIQESIGFSYSGQQYTMNLNMQMKLTAHNKP